MLCNNKKNKNLRSFIGNRQFLQIKKTTYYFQSKGGYTGNVKHEGGEIFSIEHCSHYGNCILAVKREGGTKAHSFTVRKVKGGRDIFDILKICGG